MEDKEGFTLVELAVVIVIVGLFVGGILVAQSMIQTSRINSFVHQLGQINIAVSNFRNSYNSWPGDTTLMQPAGNGNGIINHVGQTGYCSQYSGEAENFWTHLSLAGFDPAQRYTATVTGSFNSNSQLLNAPKAKLGNDCSVLFWSNLSASRLNYFYIANFNEVTNAGRDIFPPSAGSSSYPGNNNCIPPFNAMAVDKKIDDGSLNYTLGKAVGMFYGDTYGQATGVCKLSDPACIMFIEMQSSNR